MINSIKGSLLVAIASNRISAFDVVLSQEIPLKGQVLNQIAAHFLRQTADVVDNWLLDTPHPSVSVGVECDAYPVEIVVRSCMVGHVWREYVKGVQQVSGVRFEDGLKEYDRFDPVITPTTKEDEGHDEDISYEEIIKQGLVTKKELDEIYELAYALFARGQEMADERGLVLADTKYELGKHNGKMLLIDEVHTPDSSRYFYKDSYEAFLADRSSGVPTNLSKEFVREWLMKEGFSGKENQEVPDMNDEFVASVTDRYVKLYEEITGLSFEPAQADTVEDDMHEAIEASVAKLTRC